MYTLLMKKIAIIVGTLLVLGGGYFYFTKSVDNGTYTKQEDTKPVTTIMLYKESGFVTWRKANDTEYIRVDKDELALPNNVYVKTVEGRGYVVLPDNSSIALATNTEILINYEPTRISIEQLLGTTYHRVEALVTGSTYEVRTAGTLASVRGTKFSVTYDSKKKKTRVAVTSHKVDVVPIDTMHAVTTSTPQIIEEGKMATLIDKPEVSTGVGTSEQPILRNVVVQAMDTAPEEKKWIEENKKIDTLLDKQKDGDDKRKTIKDLMQELKQQIPTPEVTKPTTPPQDRIKVIEKVIKKIEIEQNTPVTKEETTVTQPKETTTTVPKEVTTPTTQTGETVTTQTTTSPKLKTFSMTTDVLSPEDQKFIDTFYGAYEKYLSVDANGTVCRTDINETDASIVANLEKIANDAGYVMPNKTEITALAKLVVSACKDGSFTTKIQLLQTQFDTSYPFN